jgi:hypothetical protein
MASSLPVALLSLLLPLLLSLPVTALIDSTGFTKLRYVVGLQDLDGESALGIGRPSSEIGFFWRGVFLRGRVGDVSRGVACRRQPCGTSDRSAISSLPPFTFVTPNKFSSTLSAISMV